LIECVTLAPKNVVPSAVKVIIWFPGSRPKSVVIVRVEVVELPKSRGHAGPTEDFFRPRQRSGEKRQLAFEVVKARHR